MHFQPLESEVNELKKRCTVAGICFADVKWDPDWDCLCIYEMNRKGEWYVTTPLLDTNGEPRQIHRGDVNDVSSRIYGVREDIDNWYEGLKEREKRKDEKLKAERRMRIREAIKSQRFYNQRTFGRNKSADPMRSTLCPHNSIWVDCWVCMPEKHGKKVYYQTAKSGEASTGYLHMRDDRK